MATSLVIQEEPQVQGLAEKSEQPKWPYNATNLLDNYAAPSHKSGNHMHLVNFVNKDLEEITEFSSF